MLEFPTAAFSLAPVEGLEAEPLDVLRYLRLVQTEAQSIRLVEAVARKPAPASASPSIADASIPRRPKLARWQQSILKEYIQLKHEILAPLETHLETDFPRNAADWRKLVLENPPAPFSALQSLDHLEVMRLVAHATSWLSLSTNENLSRWIYCVLLRLDKVLDANDTALVRNLGKKAAKLQERDRELGTATAVARFTFDLVLIVVGFYFDQRDIVPTFG